MYTKTTSTIDQLISTEEVQYYANLASKCIRATYISIEEAQKPQRDKQGNLQPPLLLCLGHHISFFKTLFGESNELDYSLQKTLIALLRSYDRTSHTIQSHTAFADHIPIKNTTGNDDLERKEKALLRLGIDFIFGFLKELRVIIKKEQVPDLREKTTVRKIYARTLYNLLLTRVLFDIITNVLERHESINDKTTIQKIQSLVTRIIQRTREIAYHSIDESFAHTIEYSMLLSITAKQHRNLLNSLIDARGETVGLEETLTLFLIYTTKSYALAASEKKEIRTNEPENKYRKFEEEQKDLKIRASLYWKIRLDCIQTKLLNDVQFNAEIILDNKDPQSFGEKTLTFFLTSSFCEPGKMAAAVLDRIGKDRKKDADIYAALAKKVSEKDMHGIISLLYVHLNRYRNAIEMPN